MMADQERFSEWAILELMGHRRLGGYVQEQEIAGAAFLRIDVPGDDGGPAATQFYSASSVYCLTPTTEELARAVAARSRPAPVHRFELPAPAAPVAQVEYDPDEDGHDEDDGPLPMDTMPLVGPLNDDDDQPF